MARKKKKNVPIVTPNIVPTNVSANTGVQALQDMPQQRPQFIPPVPGQLPQAIPIQPAQTKAQKKIANAKFPRARAWWEGLKGGIGGVPESFEQHPLLDPQQISILHYLQLLGAYGLENPYQEFEPIAQQAQNEFQQQTVPSLAHRFTSLGNASLSSPDFASQLGQAGAGLQENLAAQRAQYGQQNMQQALQMLQLGLNPYTENIHRPAQTGLGREAASAAIKALPMLFL